MPPPQQPETRTPEQHFEALLTELNVPRELALAVREQESGQQPFQTAQGKVLTSPKNARGWFQVRPETAAGYGLDANDPFQNIEAGLRFLKEGLEKNQYDPDLAVRYYHGGPDRRYWGPVTETYGREVGQRMRALLAAGGKPPAVAAASAAPAVDPTGLGALAKATSIGPPPPFWSWAAHPTLGALAESLDPHERQGRQNIAGGVGSVVGGTVGGIAGAALGLAGGATAGSVVPGAGTAAGGGAGLTGGAIWGRRVGSGIGAAAGGALEQALVEETGLGERISQLPWGTRNDTSQPDPTSTYAGRVGQAALTQGGTDVAGQAILWPVRHVFKLGLQSKIAKSAFEKLSDARAAAAAAFGRTQAILGEQVRAVRQAATDAAADLAADIARRREALRVDLLTRTIRPARAGKQAVEDAATAEQTRLAAEHDALIAAARRKAAETVTGATTARDAAIAAARATHEAGLAASAPSARAAGAAVADVFENAAQVPRRMLGEAVDEAARTGPERDIAGLKAEARRIATEELLPPTQTFPGQRPIDPGTRLVDPLGFPADVIENVRARPEDAGWLGRLSNIVEEARGALLQPVQQHKATEIISRILNAPDKVPFHILHQWKKELQDALRTTYDKAVRTRVQGMTMQLTKVMRETLAGHEPYDIATKAYEDVIPRYTTQLAKTIRRTARSSPEDIAQMIDIRKPTQAGFLTKLMTEAAAEGGDAAGGRKALENVQDFWFYKNVLEGSMETLGERLAVLRRNPDFARAFLGDARMQALIARAEQLAAEYPQMVGLHEARIAAAKEAGQAGVEAATAGKETALGRAKAVSLQEIRRATERVTQAVDAAMATKAQARAADRAAQTASRRAQRDVVNQAVRAKATATSPELDAATAELERLNRSTLGATLRSPVQVAADVANVVMRPLGTAYAGLGLARLALGASDADIARYVVYGSKPVKALTKAFVTSTLRREAPAIASQPVKAVVGPKLQERNQERERAGAPPRR